LLWNTTVPPAGGVGRRHADRHALVEAQHAEPADLTPDLLQGRQQEAARRPQPRFALPHLHLGDGVLA